VTAALLDLHALLDVGAVTLVEALPEPHYDAEHLPGAVPDVRVYAGGKTDWAEAGLPFEGTRALAASCPRTVSGCAPARSPNRPA
jgi:3-mercaptopyruvate sulfurtransferase SseA